MKIKNIMGMEIGTIGDELEYERREKWLAEHNAHEGDIMEDELGREFIYEIDEDGIRAKLYVPYKIK